jgi:hypothetical protein
VAPRHEVGRRRLPDVSDVHADIGVELRGAAVRVPTVAWRDERSRSPGLRRSLSKYNFGERDGLGQLGPLSYRVVGQTISIEPASTAAGNYAMYYVSGPTVLAIDSDAIDTVLEQYDDYVTTWAAIKALGKEESDTRDLYQDFYKLEADIVETLAMRDGDDPSTIVDDDARGPSWPWILPP